MITLNGEQYNCPIEVTVGVIGGKWKMLLLWHLREDVRRFNELKRLIPGSTQKMLTAQLRELERDGIVRRTVYAQVPPKVEYSLTAHGQSLRPLIEFACAWGQAHVAQVAPEFAAEMAASAGATPPELVGAGAH